MSRRRGRVVEFDREMLCLLKSERSCSTASSAVRFGRLSLRCSSMVGMNSSRLYGVLERLASSSGRAKFSDDRKEETCPAIPDIICSVIDIKSSRFAKDL